MGIPPNLVLKSTNYFNTNGNYENLVTVGLEQKVSVLKGGIISFDVGGKCDTNFDSDNICKREFNSICEIKYKQNFTDHFNAAARYRNYNYNNQFRGTVGLSYPLGERSSIYGDIHATLNQNMKTNETSFKTGTYGGISYKSKYINGLSVWVEGQGNYTPKTQKTDSSINCGLTYRF